jgi:phosphate:Na+ symporter
MKNILSILADTLTLVGSLGLFLYGMKLMSEALQNVAGSKMRQILAAMTNNRLKGVLTGFLVTTTIQSSSATTVMIVSFVNAGLISLVASVGVIMGANIGTTVTAWLIAILGFKVSLSFLSLPLIGLSFPLFFSKNSKRKSWGEFIIGFAILFIGLQFLKDNVPGIDDAETLSFLASLTDLGFLSTLIFILVGTILTVILQSSSATMALTLVMCYNGLISFEMAAAMVLGENIGTTITANIASYVANVTAKRAARAHFIFNVFGVIWMLIVFHPFLRGIDWFLQEKHGASLLNTHLSQTDFDSIKYLYPIGLAIFHTSFNIINTLALVGFAPFIAKVATKMVPDRGEDDEEFRLKYINTGFVSTGELSIVQANQEMGEFGKRLAKMFNYARSLNNIEKKKKYDKTISKIEKYEDIADNLEIEIANYLTQISSGRISDESSNKIRTMLKIVDEMESVADAIFRFSKIFQNYKESKSEFTDYQLRSLNEMYDLIEEAFDEMQKNIVSVFSDVNVDKAIAIEGKINDKRNQLRIQHVKDLEKKKYNQETGTFYRDMFSITERIGDFIINVSEAIEEYQKA